MSTIKLGIIGCGIITKKKHLPAITRLTDQVKIIAVCNRSIGKAREVADMLELPGTSVWTDWEKMIQEVKELDAVLIALPIPMNHPVSKACCKAGLSVLCEKPAGFSIEQAVDTGTFSTTYGVTYLTGENYQYKPKYTMALDLINKGAIGKVYSISWNYLKYMAVDNPYNQTQWRTHTQYPGGFVLDGGVHFVHTVQMFGGAVTSVYARTASVDKQVGPMDTAFSLLTHETGIITTLNMGWRSAGHTDDCIRIFGDAGALTIRDDDIVQANPGKPDVIHQPAKENSFYLMWKDFLNSLKTGIAPQMPTEAPVRDVKVIMGMLESGKTGKPVAIS